MHKLALHHISGISVRTKNNMHIACYLINLNNPISYVCVQIYTYLIICSYVFGQFYSVISTLITPVLSDQFGFTVEYTSHYLIGVAVALFMGSVIQYVSNAKQQLYTVSI